MVKVGHELLDENAIKRTVAAVEKSHSRQIRLLDENNNLIIEGHINQRVNPRNWYIPDHYVVPGNFSTYPGHGFQPRPK